jgi:two-component system OmpR family sensor kinase
VKHISVTTFIHILFTTALAILVVTLIYFVSSSLRKDQDVEITRYKFLVESLATNLRQDPPQAKIDKFLHKFHLQLIPPEQVRSQIETKGETVMIVGDPDAPDVRVFTLKARDSWLKKFLEIPTQKTYYIYVDMPGYRMMLVDDQKRGEMIDIVTLVGAVLFLLLLGLYYMVLKKLYPLKRLHKQIEQFAAGDLNVKIAYDSHDEIGKIARSFDKAIGHIHQLMSSKNLFMRNIMHELKTPITKGRIVAETIDDETAKGFLIKAFERMNELISDLADVERITMYDFKPNIEEVFLQDVVQRAERILLADPKRYTIRIDDRPIRTDMKLLALALKNLMDNGIKYSPDKHVTLQSVGNRLEVRSKGEPLKEDFAFYIEPFSQEEKRSSGFGLGLYIVNSITEKLGYPFRYNYDQEKGENVFSIVIN